MQPEKLPLSGLSVRCLHHIQGMWVEQLFYCSHGNASTNAFVLDSV